MVERVFFYGTLMNGLRRLGSQVDLRLQIEGRGSIGAALFDLGSYPAAIPADDSRVYGEIHRMLDTGAVLAILDEFEGHRPDAPDASLYRRSVVSAAFEDGPETPAWVYFYNAPIERAHRIKSGDYLEHLGIRRRASGSAVPP
jgi:gamma-glutamylcyclotransferase (GGCT)/AIG2-like uncharacterized protein YtfP